MDATLFQISESGTLKQGRQITLGTSSNPYDMTLPHDALKVVNNYYIFSGYSIGFNTQIQSELFNNSKSNVFTMRYLFSKDQSYACLYEANLNPSSYSSQCKRLLANVLFSYENGNCQQQPCLQVDANQSPGFRATHLPE